MHDIQGPFVPPIAQRFLARLADLPPAAWLGAVERWRELPDPGYHDAQARLDALVEAFDRHEELMVAEARASRLAKRLNWDAAAGPVAGRRRDCVHDAVAVAWVALQGLVVADVATRETVLGVYGPFDTTIPLESLEENVSSDS